MDEGEFMAVNIYNQGKLKGTVVDDNIEWVDEASNLDEYLENAVVSMGHEEDKWGNVIMIKVENSLTSKLLHLEELGYNMKEENDD